MPNLRPIRRGQLISPFGIGALVDFRGDESLMTAGLDEWPFAKDECPADWLVREERLQARLGVTHFRLPPEYREPGQGSSLRTSTYRSSGFPAGTTVPAGAPWSNCRFTATGRNVPADRASTANRYPSGSVPT